MNGFDHKLTDNDALEAELPDFDDDLCSLGLLVDRVTGQFYKDLHTLAEVLPSMSDAQRKHALLEFIGHGGRRLMRLAALVRWSNNSIALRKCTVCYLSCLILEIVVCQYACASEHCRFLAKSKRAV